MPPPQQPQQQHGSDSDHRTNGRIDPPVPPCMAKRWLPVSHRHGCAVYRHENVSGEEQGSIGGERMVSAIIRGTPQQCLQALGALSSRGSSAGSSSSINSILGPASAVTEQLVGAMPPQLQQQQEEQGVDGSGSSSTKVLHITLASPCCVPANNNSSSSSGTSKARPAGGSVLTQWLCSALLRPRCVVVLQTLRHDPRGIYCLTFKSVTPEELSHLQPQHGHSNNDKPPQQQQQPQQGPRKRRHQHHQHQQHQQQQQQRDSSSQSHHQRQQQQQHQQGAGSVSVLLLRPLQLLLSALGSLLAALLAPLLGRPSCSSSSSSSWSCGRLWGPVHVHVVGGFTVAGLDTAAAGSNGADACAGADAGGASETLVTSIIKIDLGGCLSEPAAQRLSGSGGSSSICSLLCAGVVDALLQQVLSAAEGVKQEVEQQQQQQQHRHQQAAACHALLGPPPAPPPQQQQPSMLQALASNLTSLASLALAPLTAWQQLQGPDSLSPSGGGGSSGGRTRSSTGGAVHAAAYGVNGSLPAGAAAAAAGALVGLDAQGQPLTGFCNPSFWSPLHQPDCPALFQVRGPQYLSNRVKVSAGHSAYTLLSVDLVSTAAPVPHIARFLPSVRRSRAASAFVVNMLVPTSGDVMNLVMMWGSARPWPVQAPPCGAAASSNGSNSSSGGGGGAGGGRATASSAGGGAGAGSSTALSADGSSSSSGDGSGFDNTLRRFLLADDAERSNMFKMIPRIQVGPWLLQQMVGTTPVIMGRKLETTYHLTERYMEVDINVVSCAAAGFIVQSIRGATTSLVVDLCFLLEGRRADELPEQLIGAARFSNLDMEATVPLDVSSDEA